MRLGDLLIHKRLLTEDQLRIAMIEQKKQNLPLGKILVKIGFITERELSNALGDQLGHESIDLAKAVADSLALSLIPKEHARRFKLVPVALNTEKRVLTIAMADVQDVIAIDQTRALIGSSIQLKVQLAADGEIQSATDRFYGHQTSIAGILNELETGVVDYASLQSGNAELTHPLIRLVDALLTDAVRQGASDIHFEPEEGFLRVRYRIDGVLIEVQTLHKNYWSGIAVRLKVMSKMDIAETRVPQDGRISLTLNGRVVDFRVASHPTSFGENIVLRVLDREKGIVPLEKLGLADETLTLLKLVMARPEGIILVTGPTGSGKTTTLYSMLNHVNDVTVNIMTLEDPVEYPMAMIRQSSVSDNGKMSFAAGIRSLMRQDPDIILVGEVRDEETAVMAFRAAMTGHQVFTSLHTNSALGAVPRLIDIGVPASLMAGNIIGIIAQRLVRRLCQHCKQPQEANEIERFVLGVPDGEAATVYVPSGCDHCQGRGYKGRLALIEVLKMNKELDELVARNASMGELRELALQQGFLPMVEDGLRYVRRGVTSLDEVGRVVDLTERIN